MPFIFYKLKTLCNTALQQYLSYYTIVWHEKQLLSVHTVHVIFAWVSLEILTYCTNYIYTIVKEKAMKQTKLIKEMYKASLSHDVKAIEELRKEEFRKIAERKAKGKSFNHKWTLADGF